MQSLVCSLRCVTAQALLIGSCFLVSCHTGIQSGHDASHPAGLSDLQTVNASLTSLEEPSVPTTFPATTAAAAEEPQGPSTSRSTQGSSSTRAQGMNRSASQGNPRASSGGGDVSGTPNKTRAGVELAFNNGDSGDYLALDLEVAHRILPQLEVGGVFGTYSEDSDDGDEESAWYLGPTARFYFVDKGEWQPWVTATVAIGETESTIFDPGFGGTIEVDSDLTLFQIGVGVSYFVSNWVAFEAALVRNMYDYDVTFNAGGFSGSDEADADDTRLTIGISTFF